MSKKSLILSCALCFLVTACGVGETAVTAAAVAKSEAKQAEQAKQQLDQVQQQLNAATHQAEVQRQALDDAAK